MNYDSKKQYNRRQDRILISGSVVILAGFFFTSVAQYRSTDLATVYAQETVRKDESREYLRTLGIALMGLGAIGSIGLMRRNEQKYKELSDRT